MIVYHGTSYANGLSIMVNGPRLSETMGESSRATGTAGAAFYTTDDPEEAAGYGPLVLKLNLHPLAVVCKNEDVPDAIQPGHQMREWAIGHGFEAMLTSYEGDGDEMVREIAVYDVSKLMYAGVVS